jgi:hypothetical protein
MKQEKKTRAPLFAYLNGVTEKNGQQVLELDLVRFTSTGSPILEERLNHALSGDDEAYEKLLSVLDGKCAARGQRLERMLFRWTDDVKELPGR